MVSCNVIVWFTHAYTQAHTHNCREITLKPNKLTLENKNYPYSQFAINSFNAKRTIVSGSAKSLKSNTLRLLKVRESLTFTFWKFLSLEPGRVKADAEMLWIK